jgi:hypothetical protein
VLLVCAQCSIVAEGAAGLLHSIKAEGTAGLLHSVVAEGTAGLLHCIVAEGAAFHSSASFELRSTIFRHKVNVQDYLCGSKLTVHPFTSA